MKFADTGHARNYCKIAFDYAKNAVKDKKNHCKWVRLAAKRHLDDLKKKNWPYKFDPWHGNDVCDFVEKFPHIEGTWEDPDIKLEPVQVFILVCIFGWRVKKTGNRRFTSVYIEMARKGAKSTLTAPVSHYCLTCEGENGPQIIIGATTAEQALKVFKPAKNMAERMPEYCDEFGIEVFAKSIVCNQNNGFIQTINSKGKTQDGWNPHMGILDELHAHANRDLYDVIKSAFGSRRNPLFWIITTAGSNISGVCYEQHVYVKKILENILEANHYFGIIFTLDEGDSEFDPKVWIKANPLLGITPTIESMEKYAADAKASPDENVEFKTKRCNIWTSAKGAWLNVEDWKKCNGPVNLDELVELPCYGGLDLASVQDTNCFILIWRAGDRLKVWPRFYLPEDTIIPRTEKGFVPYQTWMEKGFLIATPGNVVDQKFIEKDIRESLDRFNIKQIGYDRWNSDYLITNLLENGAPMIEVAQGPKSFNTPMKEVEEMLGRKEIDHAGHPVLQWHASNVIPKHDENKNKAPDKKNSMEKIDGIVAMLNAMVAEKADETSPSVYESRGLRTL